MSETLEDRIILPRNTVVVGKCNSLKENDLKERINLTAAEKVVF